MEGRASHLVRGGWLAPWRAGWANLKAMLVFGADFFLIVPGLLLFGAGLVPLFLLATGPMVINEIKFSINSMLFCLLVTLLGLQFILIGAIAETLYDVVGKKRKRWLALFEYTRTTVASVVLFAIGFYFVARFLLAFAAENYRVVDLIIDANHHAIFGLFLMISGALVF